MTSPALEPLTRPGRTLLGKYRVERALGAGGMGVVVSATHAVLGERVAIKLLADGAAARPEQLARFVREAQTAARLKSEHVARVFDAGTLPEGAPYMVLELLDGHDLAALLKERGRLPVTEAVDCVLQACEALAEAHSLGIVHRDVKPANLFLARRPDGSPCLKVLDFGVSKVLEGDEKLTCTTDSLGSPAYMSPEQVRAAKTVGAPTDVWSLGVTLHELLTGRPPFRAASPGALFAAIDSDPPERLRDALPEAPEALERALLRCLEKRPDRRLPGMAALAEALAPFGSAAGAVAAGRAVAIEALAARAGRGRGVPAGGEVTLDPSAEPARVATRESVGAPEQAPPGEPAGRGSNPAAVSAAAPPAATKHAAPPPRSRLVAPAIIVAAGATTWLVATAAFDALGPDRAAVAAPVRSGGAARAVVAASSSAPASASAPVSASADVPASDGSAKAAVSAAVSAQAVASAAPSATARPVVRRKPPPPVATREEYEGRHW
ncbi:MAG: serine/threonine protein kinase [Polyangiaceae bacterium]|nr:serine/threonine protein kinase [Polyangiaceae bacterium]